MVAERMSSEAGIWEYEAPQYCDFSATETFGPDPESDKFFRTFLLQLSLLFLITLL